MEAFQVLTCSWRRSDNMNSMQSAVTMTSMYEQKEAVLVHERIRTSFLRKLDYMLMIPHAYGYRLLQPTMINGYPARRSVMPRLRTLNPVAKCIIGR
jgi:hypothetical protein